ncbi:MAG: CDGSH iron-sulfur domain-containing protein [Candidatus Rariloculaceae bacterium]
MQKPEIFSKAPFMVDIDAGTFYWCTCGKSDNQPFCDGSHKGTEFKPQAFTIKKKRRVALCNCKHTENSPFCDGTHKRL